MRVFLIFLAFIVSQNNIFSQKKKKDYPEETIFVHLNSTMLLSGEKLYYSLYCLDSKGEKSPYSKIAYVSLVDIEKKEKLKLKLKLNNGLGRGEARIPIGLPSGNYKIIAYTQWMKNFKDDAFFKEDITIVNPYQENQNVFVVKEKDSITSTLKEVSLKKPVLSPYFKIDIDKKKFLKREKVLIKIKKEADKNLEGDYSISVKKIDKLDELGKRRINAIGFKSRIKNKTITDNEIVFFPELRGELISGKLLLKKDKLPVKNQKLSLSIPDKDFILEFSSTDSQGHFNFNLNKKYIGSRGFIQVLNKNNKDYDIVFENRELDLTKMKFTFNQVKIPESYKDVILRRSINNQIENSYKAIHQDSIIQYKNSSLKDLPKKVFKLEDYTKFKTVKEVFIEIIEHASIIKDSENRDVFHTESLGGYLENQPKALVIVDGVLQEDVSKIIDFKASEIDNISLIRTKTKFIFGGNAYQGILIFETKSKKFNEEVENDFFMVQLSPTQLEKEYFKKSYLTPKSRIPDYRNQLLWNPHIKLDKSTTVLEFYTSDNSGVYEVCVEGFTKKGIPVTLKEYIMIE
ncbi:hypothetical protein [uncultured Tenacibaculum sp.]|uniref:hypothetical protein n=1 Tax=uncultured Tenacibaculum sp. TaxID=174713 RepID=UPI00261C711B|nr:hypothetical protein [uncultured Tenacibaculum sp.]